MNQSKAVVRPASAVAGPKTRRGFWARMLDTLRLIWRSRLSYLLMAPFLICFALFTIIPVLIASGLSFTYFNAIEAPVFSGWINFQNLLSQDVIFLRDVVPNTFRYALFVGPVGYALGFLLAYLISQMPPRARLWYALALYAPSLTAGVAMGVVWQVMFTGDRSGYINSLLLQWGIIERPLLFVLDENYLLTVMIVVSVWASMGVGFLAVLAGLLNVDRQLYEAGRIDGVSSRLQEIWYITIPVMKPQMVFAAVMSIVYTLKSGDIGVALSGQNPTPNYAGQLMINHIQDYGFIRYELGYACAVSVVLLLVMMGLNKLFFMVFAAGEEKA